MKTITLQIECGEDTCASEAGKFCEYLGTSTSITPVCALFPFDEASYTRLDFDQSVVRRCDACKEATK